VAPTNTKTYRQIDVDRENIDYDSGKHLLRMRTELGYNVIFEVDPYVSINYADGFNPQGMPEFQTNILMKPVKVEKGDKPMSLDSIKEMLAKRSVVPKSIQYENFTLGFVYANAQNPQNHKWMLEFRRQQQIFYAMHFLGISCKKIPITTTSWFDGVYHGRFLCQKDDLGMVSEQKPGWIVVEGKDLTKKEEGRDITKVIPEGSEKLRLRYNIREDFWYGDILKPGQVIPEIKPLKMRHITAENMDFLGLADFSFQKPKVSYIVETKTIADIRMMADTLFLVGKGDD